MEKNKRNQIIKISVFIISIFVIFLSVTYAFINVQLTGTKKQVITSGVLDLELEEENEITITDALPMYDEVGMIQEDVFVFRLINKTANDTKYVLKLQEIGTGTLDKSDVKYGLIKDGKTTIDFVSNITDGIIDEGTITGNDTIEYELRLWIDSKVTETTEIRSKFLSFGLAATTTQEIERVVYVDTLENKVDTTTTINFKKISSATNGRGIYKYQEDGVDIYYWRGNVASTTNSDNNVIFAGMCWQMVRTTKTGGIKMIYNGVATSDGTKCENTTAESRQLATTSAFNTNPLSPAYIGYMYGNSTYDSKSKISTSTELTTAGVKYGYDVDWNGTSYTLKAKKGGSLYEATGVWDTDRPNVENANHYTCLNTTGECSKLYYIFYTGSGNWIYYIELSNGTTVEKALEQMHSNEQNSTVKQIVETWFEGTDLVKEENLSKLEDPVFCNDRSSTESELAGWSKDGNPSINMLYFSTNTRINNGTPDLNCRTRSDNRDRFTYQDTVEGNGLLKYPVGLLTTDEAILAGGQTAANSDFYLYTGQSYWTLSAFSHIHYGSYGSPVYSDGSLHSILPSYVSYSEGVRPVISLAAGTSFVDGGTGTAENPYVVE